MIITKSKTKNLTAAHSMKSGAGFTLIELLVVISIIGLLASVVLVSLNGARIKARNVKRKADLRQIATALELYYTDNNSYPSTPSAGIISSEPGGDVLCGSSSASPTDWVPGLAGKYLSRLPREPLGGLSSNPICAASGCYNSYRYRSDGIDYKLFAHCGPEGTWDSTDPFYDPKAPVVPSSWTIQTPGAAAKGW